MYIQGSREDYWKGTGREMMMDRSNSVFALAGIVLLEMPYPEARGIHQSAAEQRARQPVIYRSQNWNCWGICPLPVLL